MDDRIRSLLVGLGVPWNPARRTAIRHLLELEPVPGVTFDSGMVATREQLGRVHTISYLDHIFVLRGQSAWLDVDTTAVVVPGDAVVPGQIPNVRRGQPQMCR